MRKLRVWARMNTHSWASRRPSGKAREVNRLVHVARDDGETWENVTPGDLGSMVNSIDVSPHDPGTVYVALGREIEYGSQYRTMPKSSVDEDEGRH